jgi:Ulp1 protease family, C-terminal catalytic domain
LKSVREILIMPLCYHNHWSLGVVRPAERLIVYYDSVRPEANVADIKNALLQFANKLFDFNQLLTPTPWKFKSKVGLIWFLLLVLLILTPTIRNRFSKQMALTAE